MNPAVSDPDFTLYVGNLFDVLPSLPAASVHCVVTSPPYWGLRDYGTATWEGGDPTCQHRVGGQVPDGKAPASITAGVRPGVDASRCLDCGAVRIDDQLGLEPNPDCLGWATGERCEACYICRMVAAFREVRRVLRKDGTLWLNIGDSFASKARGSDKGWDKCRLTNPGRQQKAQSASLRGTGERHRGKDAGLKEKDMVAIPWRLGLALQADGWYLRIDVIDDEPWSPVVVWNKPNGMPESVSDRPTCSHEYILLLAKSPRYFYDLDAISERVVGDDEITKNARSVWTVNTTAYGGAHFAVMAPEIARRCILAGTSAHGVCSACGAPWKRIVEKGKPKLGANTWSPKGASQYEVGENAMVERGLAGNSTLKHIRPRITRGWQPTCKCEGADVVPAVVLDPFGGAATTAVVARELRRHAVAVELSPDHARLAAERLAQQSLLTVASPA